MTTKHEIIREKLTEYVGASKKRRGAILTAICEATGLPRRTVIVRLGTLRKRPAWWKDKRHGRVRYGEDVIAALRDVWEMASRICAERLRPKMAEYVRILIRDREWRHGKSATAKLLAMSLGTMKDRLATFPDDRRRAGLGTTKPSALKEIIPIRRGPWENPDPGHGEVDTVAHCGASIAGDFVYTVQYTDVATIWTLLCAQWNKGESATTESIDAMRERLPFPLRGIDPDSGSEFVNWKLKAYCDLHGIAMTRTRPYMKNDHARIEQKNYSNIRKFVGYTRLGNAKHVQLLNDAYAILEDYLNFFIPSVKCISKERIGSRTKRTYDTPKTAYERVLAHPNISGGAKEKLRAKYETLNPLDLKRRLDTALSKLKRGC